MNAKRSLALAIALCSLIAVLGFTPAASARTRVSIGIGLGFPVYYGPPPLRREVIYAQPGPGYTWVDGYWDWDPGYQDYVWIGGRWVLPSYYDSYWVAPRYSGNYFYGGYWGRGFDRGFRDRGFRHDRDDFRGFRHDRDDFRSSRGRDDFRSHDRGHDRRDHDRGGHDHRRY